MSRRDRTRARELALQALYQADLMGDDVLEDIEATLLHDGHPEVSVGYAFDLARGVRQRVLELDALLRDAAQHWSVERMAVIDRNILRMGVEEFLHHRDVPPRVVINEAIELAKRFSTGQSGSFVNGVLDRVRRDLVAAGRIGGPEGAAPVAEGAAATDEAPTDPAPTDTTPTDTAATDAAPTDTAATDAAPAGTARADDAAETAPDKA